ncbi:MAG: hypothetical protein Q9170_005834 [Blastenia crenularia]
MAFTPSPPPGFLPIDGSRVSPSGSREPSAAESHPYSQDPRLMIRKPPTSEDFPQAASETYYIQQCRNALEHQRRAFDDERAMWNYERTRLVERIASAEEALRWFQPPVPGQHSTSTKSSSSSDPSWYKKFPRDSWAKPTTSTSTDPYEYDECGLRISGGVLGPSTRTPSGPGTHHDLPDTTKNVPPPRSLSETVSQSKPFRSPIGNNGDPFDGIALRSRSRPNSIKGTQTIISVRPASSAPPAHQSPSSLSTSRGSPMRLKLPSVEEEPSNLTKHAGHTPLARTVPGLDGTASALESDLPTPSHMEQERPSHEPSSSIAKIPSERSESYFPPPADEYDEDPELRGQLGLKNQASSDNRFLSELNKKLTQAAKSSSPPAASRAKLEANSQSIDEVDEDEPEPKLRIKRSMNFGSQLGGTFGPQSRDSGS